jgi:hypothetical protein
LRGGFSVSLRYKNPGLGNLRPSVCKAVLVKPYAYGRYSARFVLGEKIFIVFIKGIKGKIVLVYVSQD